MILLRLSGFFQHTDTLSTFLKNKEKIFWCEGGEGEKGWGNQEIQRETSAFWNFSSEAEQFDTELVYLNFETLALGNMIASRSKITFCKSVLGKSETVNQCKWCK